jgi:hypothetical protein
MASFQRFDVCIRPFSLSSFSAFFSLVSSRSASVFPYAAYCKCVTYNLFAFKIYVEQNGQTGKHLRLQETFVEDFVIHSRIDHGSSSRIMNKIVCFMFVSFCVSCNLVVFFYHDKELREV